MPWPEILCCCSLLPWLDLLWLVFAEQCTRLSPLIAGIITLTLKFLKIRLCYQFLRLSTFIWYCFQCYTGGVAVEYMDTRPFKWSSWAAWSQAYELLTDLRSLFRVIICFWRHGNLMVSVFIPRASSLGASPGRGHCVVFLGKTLNSRSASLHPWV